MSEFKDTLKDAIEGVVTSHQGLKGSQLATELAGRFHSVPEFNADFLLQTLEEMVEEERILEIEYVLPEMEYRAKSFFLPKNTTVSVNF